MHSISIIIPVFNVDKYLSKCLDSILVDNHFDGELICVNDGSTDNSLQILKNYGERYNNLTIISQDNAGLGAARNTGIKYATGEYLMFIDSDDFLQLDSLPLIVSSIDGEDILYFNAKYYTKSSYEFIPLLPQINKCSGMDYYEKVISHGNIATAICVCLGIYRKQFLLDNNLYMPTGIYHEDELFTPKALFFAQRVSTIPVTAYNYRIREGSITYYTTSKHLKDISFIVSELFRFFKKRQYLNYYTKERIIILLYAAIERSLYNNIPRQHFFNLSNWYIFFKCTKNRMERRIAMLLLFDFKTAVLYRDYKLSHWKRKIIKTYIVKALVINGYCPAGVKSFCIKDY